jgi:signal transduction histidine kinase
MKNTLAKTRRWLNMHVAMLGGRNVVMLVFILLLTLASVIFSDNWIVSINRQSIVIGQIRSNLIILNQLKTNFYEADSAQRAYLLTKRADYIAPFNSALNDARANILHVEKLISRHSSMTVKSVENTLLKTISASLEAKAAAMQNTIQLAQPGKANQDLDTAELKNFMGYIDTLITHQNDELDVLIKTRQDTLLLARVSVVGSALTLILIVVLVIKQLLKETLIKNQLQQQVLKENEIYEEKLQQQTKLLRSLALDYQADVERERQKLSRELHDELGSIFTATKMDMAWVMKKLKDFMPDILGAEVSDKLKKTTGYIDQGIQFQRHIVQELHPAMLSTFGFWPALTSLVTDAAERNQWQLSLNLPDKNTKLNQTISLVAYRVVQESLNNANKYAKATAVSVQMALGEKYLKVEIEDNGVGLDMNALDGNTHGLSGMRHRVLAIGGQFEMLSELGHGVLIRALIPLDIALL